MKTVFVAQNSSYTHTNCAVRILKNAVCGRHSAKIIETTVNDRGGILALVEKLYKEKADAYAFSVYIWNRAQQFSAASALKKLLPDSLVIFGGPEVSFESDDFFEKYPFADYLIKGEGEQAICDILYGKYNRGTVVDGGIYHGFENNSEPYFCDKYSEGDADGKLVYYESSRGCPYNCSYCLSSVKRKGEKLRFKPVDTVKKELKELLSHEIRTLKFVDRTFNADRARAKELFCYIIDLVSDRCRDGIYTGPACHFEICAALLDDETVNVLSHAPSGLFQFEIGVQTVTPQSLAAIGRADDTDKILSNVRKLREHTKVAVHLDLICGLPLDTVEGIAKSFDAIYGLGDCIQVGVLKLLPGTKMREDAQKYAVKYLDTTPYTVLQTSTMSFDELCLLGRVGECAEKFSEKGNPWFNSVGYMVSFSTSPFDFYKRLSAYLERCGAVSSKKLYSVLLEFGKTELEKNEKAISILREYLRYDYIVSNQGSVPAEIDKKYTDDQAEQLAQIKHNIIHSFQKGKCTYFVPATEIHFFDFDKENAYIIDRKNKTVDIVKK